jgi:hypothetical protein
MHWNIIKYLECVDVRRLPATEYVKYISLKYLVMQ